MYQTLTIAACLVAIFALCSGDRVTYVSQESRDVTFIIKKSGTVGTGSCHASQYKIYNCGKLVDLIDNVPTSDTLSLEEGSIVEARYKSSCGTGYGVLDTIVTDSATWILP